MELAVIGGGVYLLGSLVAKGEPLSSELGDHKRNIFDDTHDFQMEEARVHGTIAPQYMNVPNRRPWHLSSAPYFLDSVGPMDVESNDDPVSTLYTRIANARVHEAKDIAEQMIAARNPYARKAGAAWYTGFTPEMELVRDGERVSTNIGPNQWLPKSPTDSDYVYAAHMHKVLPRDPLLFTGDAHYPNAAGLPFRYTNGT